LGLLVSFKKETVSSQEGVELKVIFSLQAL